MEKDKIYGPIRDCEAITHRKTGVQYVTVTVYDQEAEMYIYINACVGRKQFIELVDESKMAAPKSCMITAMVVSVLICGQSRL